MVNDQLLAYIRQESKAGVSKEQITKLAAAGGWNPADMAEAFAVIEKSTPAAPVVTPAPVTLAPATPVTAPAPVFIPKPIIITPPVIRPPAPVTAGIPALQQTQTVVESIPKQRHVMRAMGITLLILCVVAVAGVAYASSIGILPPLLSYIPSSYLAFLPSTPAPSPTPDITPATTETTNVPLATTTQAATTSSPTTPPAPYVPPIVTTPQTQTPTTQPTQQSAPQYNPQKSARDQQRVADLHKIQTALGSYYSAQSSYPSTLSDLTPQYISTLPTDPLDSTSYYYSPVGSSYTLSADLETDNQSLKTGSAIILQGGCVGASNRYCYIVSP